MSAPSTPLAQSTVPKDLFGSSARNDASVNLVITTGKLKELENDIAAEEAALESLKEAIGKSERLSNRMTKILSSFEFRMGNLEKVVMPVYRNILSMSQMNDRIEGTMELVEHLMKANEQVRKEVILLLPGPSMENLFVYLESMTRLDSIVKNLSSSDLAYCKISIERANSALRDAQAKLKTAFHDWLADCSQLSSSDDGNIIPAPLTSEMIAALSGIVNFFAGDSVQFAALIATWIDVRSNFLASSCEPLFVAAQSFEKKAGYVRRSHPLAKAYQSAMQLLENELIISSQILPETAINPTFMRSAQIIRDLAVASVEAIVSKMKKAFARREYADQVYLIDAAESAYRALGNQSPANKNLPVQVLLTSVKMFTTSVASIFTDLYGEIKGTIPRALERPFTVPENATVYELTSVVVNVLKRMAEIDGPALDAILAQQLNGNWDGSLPESAFTPTNEVPSSHENTERYVSDILGGLETCLDVKSKTLRRPMQTLLFQLNNYNYIEKNLLTLKGSFISESAIKRYDQIIEALVRSFTNSWTMIANLISESAQVVTGSGPRSGTSQHNASAKDRLKAFSLEVDEAIKIQTSCSVPDLDLRGSLKAKVHELVLPPYIYFYNQNQILFTGTTTLMGGRTGSKYHDPDHLEQLVSHLFEG